MTRVKIRAGESVDKALRVLKKMLDKEGTLKLLKGTRAYRKPSVKLREKSKAALKHKK